jgi:hypothetical protein
MSHYVHMSLFVKVLEAKARRTRQLCTIMHTIMSHAQRQIRYIRYSGQCNRMLAVTETGLFPTSFSIRGNID